MNNLIPMERIENKIYLIRGQKVMIDRDLAELYGVETRELKQAVRRNQARFPEDFMFVLNKEELDLWRSQFVISNSDLKGLRWRPFAFTEQGVAMLSSVLHSKKAISLNILIIRAFIKLRTILATHKELIERIKALEAKDLKQDEKILAIFSAIKEMLTPSTKTKGKIGFLRDGNGDNNG